jgi:hypothetical protein
VKTHRKRTAAFPAFNPEKFLAAEQKKAIAAAKPRLGSMVPIQFSKERTEAFLARLETECPEALQPGSDRTKYPASAAMLRKEVAKELAALGVAADEVLAGYLAASIANHPLFKRKARNRKGG